MGKVIAIAAEKGGVGKTTIAVNLATILASPVEAGGKGKKVLLIDTDEQCNACMNLGLSFKDLFELDQDNNARNCGRMILDNSTDMREITLKDVVPEIPNLYLIPSSFRLMYAERALTDYSHKWVDENDEIHAAIYEEALSLRKTFANNKEFLDFFDYIIIDSRPSVSQINECMLAVANSLIVVTEPSYDSLFGIETLFGFWDKVMGKIGLEVDYAESVVLNKFNKDSSVHKQILAILTGDHSNDRVPDYAWEIFGEYKNLFINVPIKESQWVLRRSADAVPIIINPNKNEREYIRTTFMPLVEELYKEGIL